MCRKINNKQYPLQSTNKFLFADNKKFLQKINNNNDDDILNAKIFLTVKSFSVPNIY